MAKAKENNFLVSGTGGAGTNGQPARYAAGIDNAQDFYELQTSQPMAGENTANKPSYAAQGAMPKISLDGLVPLDAQPRHCSTCCILAVLCKSCRITTRL
jgi:hypothetical protein